MNEPLPPFGSTDITSCDREPIEIPGSIQPHGVLLVAHPETWRILQVAGLVEGLLGHPAEDLAGMGLDEAVGAEAVQAVRHLLSGSSLAPQPLSLFRADLPGDTGRFST